MAKSKKVGKKKAHKRHRGKHRGTKVLPEHMFGKAMHKKVSRKRSRKGK